MRYLLQFSIGLAILVGVGGVTIGGGVVVFGQGENEGVVRIDEELPASVGTTLESERLNQDLLNEINYIESIRIDEAFFSDPAFDALRDFSAPLPNHSVGRSDPFRPIGFGTVPTVVATSTQ